jgi:hypothetical protein
VTCFSSRDAAGVDAGRRVALTACMRELLAILNAVIGHRTP